MRTGSTAHGGRAGSVRGREIAGIVLLAAGLFLAASLLSLQLGSGDLMGPLGRVCARALYALVDVGAHVVAARLWAGVAWAAREAGTFTMEVLRAILPDLHDEEDDTEAEAETDAVPVTVMEPESVDDTVVTQTPKKPRAKKAPREDEPTIVD